MFAEKNPFIVNGDIIPEYFCDRQKESENLTRFITSGNNVVLISPRRMGKTALIQYCFSHPEIKNNYLTFYIDILSTSSLREFILLFGRAVYSRLQPLGIKILTRFVAAMSSIAGSFGFDPVSGMPSFDLQLGDIRNPEYTLEEIFNYLSSSETPCIVAIDEFQQIARYPEKNVEALLRSRIQHMANSHFIFAGSERHMLAEMFLNSSSPFYLSAITMELRAIPLEVYRNFAVRLFSESGRELDPDAVNELYSLFDGVTLYLQRTMNFAFTSTHKGSRCDIDSIRDAVLLQLNSNDTFYREFLSNLSTSQKSLLVAIARTPGVSGIMSSDFITTHNLGSASSVQNSSKRLLNADLISRVGDIYTVSDPLFRIWICSQYGPAPFRLLGEEISTL